MREKPGTTQNNSKARLKILGLTGGIAAGKSTVSAFLKKKKGYILDCDKISHQVILKNNPAYGEILEQIPGSYLDKNGEIDRSALGQIVFGDGELLMVLERIIHKKVAEYADKKIAALQKERKGFRFIVIDAPLLLESGMDTACDAVWVVEAMKEIRIQRIMKRNGLSKEDAIHRIAVQTNWDALDKKGLVIIENNESLPCLMQALNKNLNEFLMNKPG